LSFVFVFVLKKEKHQQSLTKQSLGFAREYLEGIWMLGPIERGAA